MSGGDSRSAIDKRTGLNVYGCSPVPRPVVLNFGSSTASSISRRAFCHLECEREKLLELSPRQDFLDKQIERQRFELKGLLGLGNTGTEIVFSPSGTDSALHALFLVRALTDYAPIDNVLLASDETGSGVPYVSSGRHFSAITPDGSAVSKGEPIAGLSQGVTLIPIPIRNTEGALRSPETIDNDVLETVSLSIAMGRRVLLQVMDSSKTGLRCPSLTCLRAIQSQFGGSVQIVVDACQMRISLKRLRWHLDQGHIVLISGSKFFTGPPFSGAMLIPELLSGRMVKVTQVPPGLRNYTSKCAWPISWQRLRTALPDTSNLGQYFRWAAVLHEMRAYFAIPLEFRRSVLKQLAEVTTDLINGHQAKLVPLKEWKCPSDGIDDEEMAAGTIFSFMAQQREGWMSFDNSNKIYRALNEDISRVLPADLSRAEISLASQICHIGQPVNIPVNTSSKAGAFRICTSARTVSDAWLRNGMKNGTAIDLDRERNELQTILDKIGLASRCFDSIARSAI